MADMVCSALVQETVSRGVSFVLGLGKREEKASQGHLAERLEMAISQLEFALERAQELRIRDLSLISQREMIKRAYVEAMELLDSHKQQNAVPPGQELQVAQGVKRKRWFFWAKDVPITSSFAGLTTDVVRRFEMYADFAGKFGCSLHHYPWKRNPIVSLLLEGKILWYNLKQGNLARKLRILPTYSDERGVEAALLYSYEDKTMVEKCFTLWLFLRLSESTDIVGLVIKGLQILKAAFKHPVESAMAELTLVPNLQFQDIVHLNGRDLVWHQNCCILITQCARPDPACCKGRRPGLCSKDNQVSSGLSDIFPEQVIYWDFRCYYVPALESSTPSSFDEVGRGCNPPMEVSIQFWPHFHRLKSLKYIIDLSEGESAKVPYNYAIERIGHDVEKHIHDVSIQKVVETVKSNAISCFSRQPEPRDYTIDWFSKHGEAWFVVKNASVETTAGVPRTRKRYNTRSSKNKGASSRR